MQSQATLDNLLKFNDKEFIYTWRIKDFQEHYKDMPDRKNDHYLFSEKFSSPGPHITQTDFDPQLLTYKWRLRLRIHGYRDTGYYYNYTTQDNKINNISLNLISYDKEFVKSKEDQEIGYKFEVIRSHPDNHVVFQQQSGIYDPKTSEKNFGEIINIFPNQDVGSRTDLRIRVYITITEKKSQQENTPRLLLPGFIDYFDNEFFSDIKFTFDCGSSIKASKIILVAQSEYFRTMFNGKWKESKESKIHISETKCKIFRYLLKYLYTNELDEGLSLEELQDLYMESDLRDLENLRKMITISIGERMNVENWDQVLKFGYETDNEGIKYSATLFGINNWEEICEKKQHKELTLDNILSLKLILLNFENTEPYKKIDFKNNLVDFFNYDFKKFFEHTGFYFFLLIVLACIGYTNSTLTLLHEQFIAISNH